MTSPPTNPRRLCPHDITGGRRLSVVHHDTVEGGTKALVLPDILRKIGADVYVYASPSWGYAQFALAVACAEVGATARIYVPARKQPSTPTQAAIAAGAVVEQIRPGYLNVVQKRAADWSAAHGARLLPFGLHMPEMTLGLVGLAEQIYPQPEPDARVWVAAGSGTLWQALQLAWPRSVFGVVQVGKPLRADWLRGPDCLYVAPEKFERPAKQPPPFPSAANYDAKVWQFIQQDARDGDVFWNVAG
jgi:hypothetical protein